MLLFSAFIAEFLVIFMRCLPVSKGDPNEVDLLSSLNSVVGT